MLFTFLFIYFIIFFGIAFVLKSFLVARRIKKNPVVLPNDDSAYWIVGIYFKLTLFILFIYTFTITVFPDGYNIFLPIEIPYENFLKWLWIFLLFIAMSVTFLAQLHMKDSWRIWIDTEQETELITSWIFHYSRNPIFFGMTLVLLWLVCVTPNWFTLAVLCIWHMLIQIQIRLEEEFLEKQHGKLYLEYKNRVRRMF